MLKLFNTTSKVIRKMVIFALTVCMALPMLTPMVSKAAEDTLLSTYGKTYGYSGTCINLNQLKDQNTLNQVKKQYNSITLENEMKPDAILGGSPSLISKDQAKNMGYYVPSSCSETYLPKLNFDTIDQVLKICSENGIGVRAHTLVWHSQTPAWFFRVGYSTNYGYVNQSTMNARMEYYIKSVMNHVYTSQYGDCVYAWDVVNEYFHATNSGWEAVYGNGGTRPAFVKRAFQYAYDCISYFKKTDSVSLFYNDFNTYMEVSDVITMINYINSEKKLCDGVGMQSHLGTNFPSVQYYTDALQAFVNAGFEVQITEMDVTNSSDQNQADYMYALMKNINTIKKNGGNITGITHWGLSDQVTWISGQRPLMFSNLTTPKTAYYSVLQAYKDVFGSTTGNNNQGNTNQGTVTLQDGWYYIKNTNAQKYLQVAGNVGGNGVNVEIGTGTGVKGQKWYLTNQSNGYFTLKNGNGYMLDICYGEDQDGTNVQTYEANNMDPQLFTVVKTNQNNVYGICTKCSSGKKALDVYQFGTSDGANVCQWTYYGNTCQEWVFEACSN